MTDPAHSRAAGGVQQPPDEVTGFTISRVCEPASGQWIDLDPKAYVTRAEDLARMVDEIRTWMGTDPPHPKTQAVRHLYGAPGQRDAQWEREHLYSLMDQIPGCGCGYPTDAYDLVRNLLNLMPLYDADHRAQATALLGSPGASHIVLAALRDVGLIDHGSAATSSWITDKGRYARYLMGRHPWNDSAPGADDGVDMTGYPDCFDHAEDTCPDTCWTPPPGLELSDPARPVSAEQQLREAVADQRASMTPVERELSDAAVNLLLYGTPQAPAVPPRYTGLLGSGARPGQGGAAVPAQRTAPAQPGLPYDYPQGDAVFYFALRSAQAGGERSRNPYASCRVVAGTWIHGRPHTCPIYARG